MFRVRRIRVDEGSLLRAMRLAALADAPGDATTTLDRAVARDDEHWIAAAEANASGSLQATFFAERGETEEPGPAESGVVGMVGAYANRDGVVNVVGLWTAPGFRQLGVASGLLDAVAAWARDIGAMRLRIWVVERNEHALRFYADEGFEATGSIMPYEPEPAIRQVELVHTI